MDLQNILKTYFGYDEFRNGQDKLIESIIKGRDALGIMPTGGGKSICYQLPAIALDGITIDKFNEGKESLEDFWICGDLGLGLINQI
jgi:hypothetical protein